ncbi:hypothetical protein DYB32_002205 [Aphanomyces invadans]|uniref:PX domain-containing protein n=1 Tax=Aphanomyces invadans TaxID=157072 RepID=A0A418B5A1_9STRA|nr:hypothetical protein DYB32_002205 [Aphanomyces invadans]
MARSTEPFASSRVHFLQYIDVLVCATNAGDAGHQRHVQYMVQVNEVGKGHWVVPRRYTQFRLLWRSVQDLARASTVKPTESNAGSMGRLQRLAEFDFPKKTLKVLFVGTDASSAVVVQARVERFHTFLTTLVRFLLDFEWGEERRHVNAITTRDATKLFWLVAKFIGVPSTFRTTTMDYLHNHPVCQHMPAAPCHKYPIVEPAPRRHSIFKPASRAQLTLRHRSSAMADAAVMGNPPSSASGLPHGMFRKQQSKSDPIPRPSVWLESMRGCSIAHSDIFSTPMLGDVPDSPRDTIILGD